MRLFVFLSLLAASSVAYAQFFNVDIANNQEIVLPGDNYIFVGHATSYWDQNSSSRAGVQTLIQWGRQVGVPVIGAVHSRAIHDEFTAKEYFFQDSDLDIVVESEAGQHKISFANAKKVFFAGGNITLCLCEGIRDAVRGNRTIESSEALNIYLVADAIYDWNPAFDPMQRKDVDRFIKRYFIPSFKCPEQNYYNFPSFTLSTVRLDVTFDGTPVQSYDLEPTDNVGINDLTHLVNVHFVRSQDLSLYY